MRFETICILSGAGDELPSSRTLEARGNGLRAPAISSGEAFGTIAKVATGHREQALFGRRMWLDGAVAEYMTNGESSFGERPADQQRAMAVERLALGTQKADAVARALIHDLRQAGRKFRLRGHRLVVGDTIAVEAHIARAAAERVTEEHVDDTCVGEPLRQRLAREPGTPSRKRDRTHIGDGAHARALEQSHETIGREIGVADGQEIAGGDHFRCALARLSAAPNRRRGRARRW